MNPRENKIYSEVNPVRVLHVINSVETGGAQTLLASLAKSFSKSIEAHLLVLADVDTLSPLFESEFASVAYLGLGKSSFGIFQLLHSAAKHIRRVNPQVVHSHLLHSDFVNLVLAKFNNWAPITTVHSSGVSQAEPTRSRLLQKIVAHCSWRFASIIASSSMAKQYALTQGYCPRLITQVNNGVYVAEKHGQDLTKRKNDFISLARFHPVKDHGNLFKAVSLVKNGISPLLTCLGEGMLLENPAVNSLTQKYGVNKKLELQGPKLNVLDQLAKHRYLVISSISESLPMAGLEAISIGVPVITTDAGDSKSLTLEDWQCVPVGDPASLASAMEKALRLSDDEYESLSARSIQLAQAHFSLLNVARSYEQIYLGVVDEDYLRH